MKRARTFSSFTKFFIFIFPVILLVSGCAPKAEVKIQLIEAATSLENQVLGTYKQIGREAWLISSVRDDAVPSETLSPSQREVFGAIENQEFNADDIAEFKDDGVIGEDYLGRIIVRKTRRFQADPNYANLVNEIIAEENNDRLIIVKRVIMENPRLKESDLNAVRKTFAGIYWREALPRHWLLDAHGNWLQRKNWVSK